MPSGETYIVALRTCTGCERGRLQEAFARCPKASLRNPEPYGIISSNSKGLALNGTQAPASSTKIESVLTGRAVSGTGREASASLYALPRP